MISSNFNLYELLNPVEYANMIATGGVSCGIQSGKFREIAVHPHIVRHYSNLINIAQSVRDIVSHPCIINNWHKDDNYLFLFATFLSDINVSNYRNICSYYRSNGQGTYSFYQDAGTRHPIFCHLGTNLSAHKLASAVDIKVPFYDKQTPSKRRSSYDSARNLIFSKTDFNLEIGINWLHCDTYVRAKRLFDKFGNMFSDLP